MNEGWSEAVDSYVQAAKLGTYFGRYYGCVIIEYSGKFIQALRTGDVRPLGLSFLTEALGPMI